MLISCFDRIKFLGIALLLLASAVSCVFIIPAHQSTTSKKSNYEEVDLEEMIRRYIAKPDQAYSAFEGIYSVSTVITSKGRSLLFSDDKERVV
jgi:hypothetical protein